MQRGVKSHNQFMYPFTPVYEYGNQILSKEAYFDEKEKKVSSGLGILGTHYQVREKGGRWKIHRTNIISSQVGLKQVVDVLLDSKVQREVPLVLGCALKKSLTIPFPNESGFSALPG